MSSDAIRLLDRLRNPAGRTARDHNERHYPNTVRRIDALAARVVTDFSKGGLP